MLNVAVIGAGIGGLAAAIALKQSGHHVEVFERAHSPRELGAGLTLWPNATAALAQLGILSRDLGRSSELRCLRLFRYDRLPLMEIPIESFSTCAMAAHRSTLHQALRTRLLASEIRLGVNCLGVREDARGAWLQGISHVNPFDLVVAADGLRSRLRLEVVGEDALRYQGYTIYRGVVESERAFLAPGDFSESWGRGLRFGLFPLGSGRWCWYAAVRQNMPLETDLENKRRHLLEHFQNWREPIAEILLATPEILCHAAYDRKPVSSWARGRVLLLGDAAHPMPANLGQGACMALEDAVVLARILETETRVPQALFAYGEARRHRVYGVAIRSARIGRIAQWRHPWTVAVRDWICRRVPGRLFTRTSRSIHAYGSAATVKALKAF